MQRTMIYLVTLLNICAILLGTGNVELAFPVLLGSILFHYLVVEGIFLIQGKGREWENIETREERLLLKNSSGRTVEFIKKIDNNKMFLAISFILLLFLSADYLFGKGQEQNVLERIDGIILILVGLVYFILDGSREKWRDIFAEIKRYFENHLAKRIGLIIGIEICIFLAGWFFIDRVLAISMNLFLLPGTAGFVFLAWFANFMNIYYTLSSQNYPVDSSKESIFIITLLMGVCAVYKPIRISIYQVYDLILFSLISVLFMLPIKIDSRLLGCCKVTAYFALVLYILFR